MKLYDKQKCVKMATCVFYLSAVALSSEVSLKHFLVSGAFTLSWDVVSYGGSFEANSR